MRANFAVAVVIALAFGSNPIRAEDEGRVPERVTFISFDARTTLVGYLLDARSQIFSTVRPNF